MSDNQETNSQSAAVGVMALLAHNPVGPDYRNEEGEQKQSKDFQSESITPNDHRRKSIVDNEETNSTPAMVDSSSSHQLPDSIRPSMSESVLMVASESLPTLPILQDESSTDDDENQHPIVQSEFAERSQGQNRSRVQSASNKQSPSGGHAQLSDGTDQEIVNILRRSPLDEDSRKSPSHRESNRVKSSSSSTKNHHEEPKHTYGLPTAIISPASRRESTNKFDPQHQSSRASSAKKSNLDDYSTESLSNRSNNKEFFTMNEQSKLIKQGEQLQIPSDDAHMKRLNSPPPSPSKVQPMDLTSHSPGKTEQKQSRPGSQIHHQAEVTPIKSPPSRNSTHQQHPTMSDHKPASTASSRKESAASDNDKNDSRRSSTSAKIVARTPAKQERKSPLEKRSAQQSRKNSSKTADQTVMTPVKINSSKSRQHSSTTDSEHEKLTNSKLPHIQSSSQSTTPTNHTWTKQVPISALPTTDNETPRSRPQSPNVEQIAERNPQSSSSKKRLFDEQKKKGPLHLFRRSNSAESFNHIPLVDDQSLDSTSGNNTETDQPKKRRVKSKTKDVETNTDSRNGNHRQQQQETNPSMTDHPSSSIRRRISSKHQKPAVTPDIEPDSNLSTTRHAVKKPKTPNKDKDPIEARSLAFHNYDHQRQTQSDTEQIVPEKRKKRRRPKRISRTTQTYECVFRRMEREEHEELRPTNDTDKNIQTRQSCLRPSAKSSKRHYPLYLSTNKFKVEEILPHQLPSSQRTTPKTSVLATSNSPRGGKLLLLRPTLPFHHTDAVNVQRINLQYAIELIPSDNKPHDTTPRQRHKSHALKQSEPTNNLPLLRSASSSAGNQSPAKSNTKEKSSANKIEDRTYQRKTGGAV